MNPAFEHSIEHSNKRIDEESVAENIEDIEEIEAMIQETQWRFGMLMRVQNDLKEREESRQNVDKQREERLNERKLFRKQAREERKRKLVIDDYKKQMGGTKREEDKEKKNRPVDLVTAREKLLCMDEYNDQARCSQKFMRTRSRYYYED